MAEGRYNDGRTAATRAVTIEFDAVAVILRDDDRLTRARWPLAEVVWLGEDRFGCGDERLVADDPEFARELRRQLPRRSHGGLWRGLAIGGGLVAAVVLFFWFGLPMIAGQAARMVPASWEEASGLWIEKQITTHLAGGRVCIEADSVRLPDAVVAQLTAAKPPRLPLRVTVLDFPVVNAFALPGGRIVVFRGLIDFMQHPNELAGVLAHEIAHSELRHPTEGAIKHAGGGLALSVLTGDLLGGSVFGAAVAAAITNSYTREAEQAADAGAIAMMRAAGLDTAPVAELFDRLAKRQVAMPGAFAVFASHPDSADRAAAMRVDTGRGVALNPSDWARLKAICGAPPKPKPPT